MQNVARVAGRIAQRATGDASESHASRTQSLARRRAISIALLSTFHLVGVWLLTTSGHNDLFPRTARARNGTRDAFACVLCANIVAYARVVGSHPGYVDDDDADEADAESSGETELERETCQAATAARFLRAPSTARCVGIACGGLTTIVFGSARAWVSETMGGFGCF